MGCLKHFFFFFFTPLHNICHKCNQTYSNQVVLFCEATTNEKSTPLPQEGFEPVTLGWWVLWWVIL